MDNSPDEQLRESDMPTTVASSRRGEVPPHGCSLSCLGCLLFIILSQAVLYIILFFLGSITPLSVWSYFHPMRKTFSLIDYRHMPESQLLDELVGEWMIEIPYWSLLGNYSDMDYWQQTRLVFKEDGTFEVRSLTLCMTCYAGSKGYYNQRPEWTGRSLTGTWERTYVSANAPGEGPLYVEGQGFIGRYQFVGIELHWNSDDETTKDLPDSPPFRLLMLWKVKERGQETYRLKIYGRGAGDPLDAGGIISKSGI